MGGARLRPLAPPQQPLTVGGADPGGAGGGRQINDRLAWLDHSDSHDISDLLTAYPKNSVTICVEPRKLIAFWVAWTCADAPMLTVLGYQQVIPWSFGCRAQ